MEVEVEVEVEGWGWWWGVKKDLAARTLPGVWDSLATMY